MLVTLYKHSHYGDAYMLHMLQIQIPCIDFTIATMAKCDRSSTEEVYIAGFVPSYLLLHKRPCSLDPFVYLLITEIEDLFINGEY